MPPATIGPYQIQRELGRGGMGQVFLALDTRLDRQVAIKSLPAHLASDPDRLARFQREAKVLASLNHPGIGAIYGLEETDGRQYLVLEYIQGETLADRLAGGAIPVDEALSIARQAAEAIEAAHEKGVIHRDVKPANVMITPDGVVKVLDFGLARTGEGAPSATSAAGPPQAPDSPTVSVHSPTIPGVILGTAGYMSPEQARGKPVDKRSDVFSFGCVLYEMFAGAGPFPGETVTDSIGAVIHAEPDWTLLRPSTPARVRELLRSCLVKDRRNRLHDIGDARLELERAIAGHEWTPGAAGTSPRKRGALLGAGIVAGAALLGLGWVLATSLTTPAQPAPSTARLLIPSRTADYYWADFPMISPDGRLVAFLARRTGSGEPCIWIRPIDSFEATPLADTANGDGYMWSSDSRSIAFIAEGKLWAIDVSQKGSRRLIAAEPMHMGLAWNRDGTILLARGIYGVESGGGIVRIPAAGGKVETVTTLDAQAFEKLHCDVHLLPDGKTFLYVALDRKPDQNVSVGRLYAGRLGSSERTFIANITSPIYYAEPGWLVYVDDGTIKAAPFDAKLLCITGDPVTIDDNANYFRPIAYAAFSVARNGTIVFATQMDDQELVWFDGAGTRLGVVGPRAFFDVPRISPDGARVAVGVDDRRTGLGDLWIFGVDRPTSTHLTSDAGWEGAPLWSRDGSLIYYSTDKNDLVDIHSIRADGSGDIRTVYGPGSGGRIWFPTSIAPDGKSLMVMGRVDKLDLDVRVLPLDGTSEAAPYRSTAAGESNGKFSPDGHWVAYVSNESGKSEVYIAPYPGPGPKVQVSEGGEFPVWAPTGDKLYYIQTRSGAQEASGLSRLMVVDLPQQSAFTSPPPPKVLLENAKNIVGFDVAPDGKRFLVQLATMETPAMRVILNALPSSATKARSPSH